MIRPTFSRLAFVTVTLCVALGAAGLALAAESAAPAADQPPAAPSLPDIQSITLEPAALTLHHKRDQQKVLVWGVAADGRRFDLTDHATLTPASAGVSIGEANYVAPVAKGRTTVKVTAKGRSAELPVEVISADEPPVMFIRDVQPILGKVGCNAGTCHGSQQGKNGFRLTLRGYDAEFDYNALVNELQGRRVNRVDPAHSLMLMKATGEIAHEGRKVIEPGSRHYDIVYKWIEQGVPYDNNPVDARPSRIEVLPEQVELDLAGRTQRILVRAHYPDGSVRDVTREAVLSSNSTEVADVDENRVTALRRGEAAVLVRYEGQYAVSEIRIMGDRSGFAWEPMPEHNFIDKHVNAKLEDVKILPSELCTDAEFIRRAYLTLTGVPPTADQARAFVEDATESQRKRAKLVDELLGSEAYVAFWSNKWADLLQCNAKQLGDKGVWVFREWIRQAIATNKPYDTFAYELISASGSNRDNPAANYLLTLGKVQEEINNNLREKFGEVDTGKITEDVSQTFLGVRFNCNKCHDHPFERWTLPQYYEFGAYFSHLQIKRGPREDERIIYTSFTGGEMTHPKTGMMVKPAVPYGQAPDLNTAHYRREAFAKWLTSADNPYFARSYVNRMWSYLLGKGIIDPADDIRASNPPSNPQLLDALTADFIHHGFDTQHLLRRIMTSRTYQLSYRSNKWNADDTINFSRYYPQRLSAEQMLDAVAKATGTKQNVQGLPAGMRSVHFADGVVKGNDFLKLFGRPKRETACECERTDNISLAHALNLVNGPIISEAVADGNSAIAQLVKNEKDNAKVIDQMYYMILNRPATDQEKKMFDLGSDDKQRLVVAQDLAWALLNSPAFLFNR